MHPASTALFLIGYGLALPIAARLASIVSGQQRLAFAGHQFGVLVAGLGWALRGTAALVLVHVVWLAAAYLWFTLSGRSAAKTPVTNRGSRR